MIHSQCFKKILILILLAIPWVTLQASSTRYHSFHCSNTHDQQLNNPLLRAESSIKKSVHTKEVVFKKAGLTIDDIDWFVPHQASLLAMHHLRKKIHIAKEKFVDIYATHETKWLLPFPLHYIRLSKKKN